MVHKPPINHEPNRTPATRVSLLFSIILAVGLFLLFIGVLETLARSGVFQRVFSLRSMGVYHTQFEIKWFKLADFVETNGSVDVLLMGNSMVNTGIDPSIFSAEYARLTGDELRVFNFGVEGLTVAPNSALARLLIEKYQPGTVIFFTEMRDYAKNNGVDVEQQLLSDPWLSSQLNVDLSSAKSSLKDSSDFLPYLLPYRNWSRADFLDTYLMSLRRYNDTTRAGYEPDLNVGKNVDRIPDPDNPKDADDFALFKNFSVDPARLGALETILSYHQEGTTVIITEMPVLPTYFVYFGGEKSHLDFLEELIPFIVDHGGSYLPAVDWELIPLENRVDHHHLNYRGAPKFSQFLAEQIAEACERNGVCLRSSDIKDGR